ncbi:PfaD family polyunsaturated fatty acid/polyketide biosynthesis protein [Thermomonospora umbrina]|uniref:PfaD family protein n=1 Tax=Thermomonospora umbrina TaxID=111806 RepID=A0A3D9SH44_9ACTN|nr:PfaD family polyunsaturated fatty acid/polyketide biosynthesis protein [Thermomonospora umbrina]REE95219.1 PfaD family protein [Thermomonospora umbrina]
MTPPEGAGRTHAPQAFWQPNGQPAAFGREALTAYAARVRDPVHVIADAGLGVGLGMGGRAGSGRDGYRLLGTVPPLYPEWLGDRSFCEAHGLRFPYVTGEMACGIATVRMVTAVARAGMLGFFGAAGLPADEVERAVVRLSAGLGRSGGWGVNLIHDPGAEDVVADVLLRHGVERISASAFMDLTPAVVRCAVSGLRADHTGRVVRRTHLFAKVSRPEVAAKFMAPAPAAILARLVDSRLITEEEAALAARIPVAGEVTVEADSGGHTDNRPLAAAFPVICRLRDRLGERHGHDTPVRIGAAGGIGDPAGVAAAFALGAAYVVTGSINQLTVEAGVSDAAKELLARAGIADTAMAPSADMFEAGIKVQVLRRGTMFAGRAARLYEIYRDHGSLEEIPARTLAGLERDLWRASVDDVWTATREFWAERDPAQLERAERDPRHRMALVFRWYLGMAGRWAIVGDRDRVTDYQLWCGPAVGAFNEWTAGSFLAEGGERTVAQVAYNLLEGAAALTRAHQLRVHGVPIPVAALSFAPRRLI